MDYKESQLEEAETPDLISLISGWEMESTLSWPKVDFCNISFPIAYYPFPFVSFISTFNYACARVINLLTFFLSLIILIYFLVFIYVSQSIIKNIVIIFHLVGVV